MRKMLLIGLVVALAGCATTSNKIGAEYASPMMFQGYTCDQLVSETYRIGERLRSLGVEMDSEAKHDNIAMGVGLFLFWPAMFLVKGNGSSKAEYARLKGEYDAIQQAGNLKNCASQPATERAYSPPPSSNGSTPPQHYEMDPAKRCDACARIGKP